MRKLLTIAAAAIFAMPSAALAQNVHSKAPVPAQRVLVSAQGAVESSAMYTEAASTAARAGVVSPANGPLSREELLSILMLMSLQQAPVTHAHSS